MSRGEKKEDGSINEVNKGRAKVNAERQSSVNRFCRFKRVSLGSVGSSYLVIFATRMSA